jgi:hypothetical protein
MHVQTGPQVGGPTVAFHLCNVITENDRGPEFSLAAVPALGACLRPAPLGEVRPLYLLAGRGLRYQVSAAGQPAQLWSLHCEVDAAGRMALVSSAGGRCIAESTWAVFSCYERNAVPDLWFDLWLLANGYTPASQEAAQWTDKCLPSSLLPSPMARTASCVAWPVAAFLSSTYQRTWDGDAPGWRQCAQHRQAFTGKSIAVESLLTAQVGCTSMSAQMDGIRYGFRAAGTFQRSDVGVPGWDSPLQATVSMA